jgi:hypothetical protein
MSLVNEVSRQQTNTGPVNVIAQEPDASSLQVRRGQAAFLAARTNIELMEREGG